LKGDFEEALKIYEDIINFLSKNINKEHIRIAQISVKLGNIYIHKTQFPKAI
jgi:hypothetical protein